VLLLNHKLHYLSFAMLQSSTKRARPKISRRSQKHVIYPLSPILFNIVADMLEIIIHSAKEDDQLAGLINHLVEGFSVH
jgi:hypothetical protein